MLDFSIITTAHFWQERALLVLSSLVVDLLVGDPARLPHPVVQIGKLISALERVLRRPQKSPLQQKAAGVVLAAVVPSVSAAVVGLLIWAAGLLHPAAAAALSVWLASTTVAARGLAQAGKKVYTELAKDDLEAARRSTGEIVGRDTHSLDRAGVVRATVETMAENIVDACVSPLFFIFLGGAPGAMLYRAINTLDSMVGYKNEKYLHFGWASARLDDLANWIPARLAGLLLTLAVALTGGQARAAWRIMRRDARKHLSPNSGWCEAGVAGALGVQLGGLNTYGGVESFRPYLGEALYPLHMNHIAKTCRLMFWTAALSALLLAGIAMAVGLCLG